MLDAIRAAGIEFRPCGDDIGDSAVLVVEKPERNQHPEVKAAAEVLLRKIEALIIEQFGDLAQDSKHDIIIGWVNALVSSVGATSYPLHVGVPTQSSIGDCFLVGPNTRRSQCC